MRTATNIRTTSLQAFRSIEPELQEREREIIIWLVRHAHLTPTRNELAEASGIRLSSVAGRVNRLVAIGVIEELPARKDKHTGRSAHPLRLAPAQRALDLEAA